MKSFPMDCPEKYPLTFKPSVYYFRNDLRKALTVTEAASVAVSVVNEFERLRSWASDQQVMPEAAVHLSAELLRVAIERAATIEAVIAIGMFACHELEELKRIIRDAGMIPPKWEVSPGEARDKGWLVEEAVQSDAVNW